MIVFISTYGVTSVRVSICSGVRLCVVVHEDGRSPEQRRLRQRKIVNAGVLVSGGMGILFNLILPWIGNYELIAIGPIFTLLFTFSIAYASVKYSMFDLRRTFAVSLAYIFASSIAALIYIGAVWTVSNMIAEGVTSWASTRCRL